MNGSHKAKTYKQYVISYAAMTAPAGQYGGEVGVDRHLEPLLLDELLLGGGREVRVVYLSESSLPEQIIIIITIIIIIIIT